MTDTPKRLIGPQLLTASAVTYYTVPAATTTILRHLHVSNVSTSAAYQFTMSIGANAAATQVFSGIYIPAAGTLDWTGFLVLNAADILQALSSTASGLNLTVSGIEVS